MYSSKEKNNLLLPYMSEDELINLIKESDYALSKQDIEYLCLKRRRQSIDLNYSPAQSDHSNLNSNYKLMILGDENSNTGKFDFYNKFINNDKYNINYPICQVKSDENTYQLWLPYCNEEYNLLRPIYYEDTSIFLLFFNIMNRESFDYIANEILPEISKFIYSKNDYIPNILLIGYNSEDRNSNAIEFDEIISLAQYYQCSKYIEIDSITSNRFNDHFNDVVNHLNKLPKIDIEMDEYFKNILTIPQPEISFHQLDKTVLITDLIEGIDYFYSYDNNVPFIENMKYKLIKYEKDINIETNFIHFIGIERCKFINYLTFNCPNESETVEGYFDIFSKLFIISNFKNNCIYYINFDNSEELVLKTNQIPIKENFQQLNIYSVENGKLKSKISSFTVPNFININSFIKFDSNDNTLKIEHLQSDIIYRYTLDGSIPTLDNNNSSTFTYTRAILLPKNVKCIKLIAFPKLQFPSQCYEIPTRPLMDNLHSTSSPLSQIKMTNTAIKRFKRNNSKIANTNSNMNTNMTNFNVVNEQIQQQPVVQHHYNHSTTPKLTHQQQPITIEPTNHSSNTQHVAHQNVAKTQVSPNQHKQLSPLRNVPTITDREIENIQPSNTQSTNQSNHPSSHTNQPPNNEKFLKTSTVSDFKVQCKAEGSNVIFTFDKKVNIKRIRIKTPGNRRGPQYYSCFIPIIPNNTNSSNFGNKSNNRMKVGEGILEDSESVQYLNLFTKDEGVKCKELICTFCPFEGQKSFKIIDMKIECN